MSDIVIDTRGLTKVYPTGVHAVDGLDLAVREGEIFGLLGPNGAGKTTTVGMLTTRVIPSGGTAVVDGIDVIGDPVRAKLRIGVVSQVNTLDRSLTVRENLYFHGRYFGLGARRARAATTELLERFGLGDHADAEIMHLSGGLAQRVQIARAIMHDPRVLFLDEPTAGLDPQTRLALWDVLRDLHARGNTILLTTHYMEEADQLSDRVAIMDHGKLLALDTPAALKRSMGAETEVRVSTDGDLAAFAAHLATLEGATAPTVVDDYVRVGMKGDAVLPRVVAHAEAGRFAITDLSVQEPTLESVFIRLTGKDLRE